MVLRLGDVSELPVETELIRDIWLARCTQWPGIASAGKTEEEAVNRLQSLVDYELSNGRHPVLTMSP